VARHGTGRGVWGDLIAAGLSEPAEWRARLWGLCRRRPVRGARSADEGGGSDWPVAAGGSVCGRLEAAGRVVSSAIYSAAMPGRVVADAGVSTGVHGVRGEEADTVGVWTRHELSSRKRGRSGTRRGRTPVRIMTPPQQGQTAGPHTRA